MIFGLMRAVRAAPLPKGIPASEARPADVHKPVPFIILIVSAIAIIWMMLYGLSNGVLWACIIGFSALILGSLFARGVSEEWRAMQPPLEDIPTVREDVYTPAMLRERAAELDAEPVPEPDPEPGVSPRLRTYKQMKEEADLNERLMRVAAILVAPCTACGAGEAEFCKFVENEPVYMLDRDRDIIAHGKRIGNAVKLNIAKVTDVVDQFEGNEHVPAEVWEAAL